MKNIAGVFDSKKEADAAVSTLLDTGFSKEHMSLIVSDNAHHAIFPGKPIKTHWGVPDPAHYQGMPAEIEAEFERIFTMLEKRVKAFLRLPLEQMDKDELQQKLNEIGTL